MRFQAEDGAVTSGTVTRVVMDPSGTMLVRPPGNPPTVASDGPWVEVELDDGRRCWVSLQNVVGV